MAIKVTRYTKRELNRLLKSIPAYISGRKTDQHRIAQVFWRNYTQFMFNKFYTSFIIKSDGGVDELGNSFPPLKDSTIIRRPIGKGELTKLKLTRKQTGISYKDRERGLLSPEQNRTWKLIFSESVRRLLLNMGEPEAKMLAAKFAWSQLKKDGALTKKKKFLDRDVKIMRETDRTIRSLKPRQMTQGDYQERVDQLYSLKNGKVVLGTRVPYAKFHNGTRDVIPPNAHEWNDAATKFAMKQVMEHIANNVV
jgi:hypothetical protein